MVRQLQGVQYSFIPTQNRIVRQGLNLPNIPQVGFLAQDVAKIARKPVLASRNPTTGAYKLIESKLVPYPVEAVKAVKAEVTTHGSQVATLRSQVSAI
jgi:hypothetical protein